MKTSSPPMIELKGFPVVGGSRVGRALIYEETPGLGAIAQAPPQDLERELQRLRAAVEMARTDLVGIGASLATQTGKIAEIFRAHAAMLEGFLPLLEEGVAEGMVAERAVASVLHSYAARLHASRNPLLVQRTQDVVDLERRLLAALAGDTPAVPRATGLGGPVVVVARDLTPSETAALDGQGVVAIALEDGGPTSHAALIAKSLGIPCVVGVSGLVERVAPGDTVWVDGSRGTVVLEPDAAAVERAVGLGERYERLEASLIAESDLPAETLDGHAALLLANVEFRPDVEAGLARGAAGVGLFRTEFLVRPGESLPTEEAQVSVYRSVLDRLGDRRLTIRTFDFGSDKGNPAPGAHPEPNPALGERSLRWCFAHPEAFQTQLRAILRVGAQGDVRIMLPMVGSLEEVRRARREVAKAAASLEAEGLEHRADLPLGVMIEIPGAAVTADLLAREADFFSIGTNDLIQYDLAVDRLNSRVAPLFRPSHPSLLRLLRATLQAAGEAEIPVTMCGEMGGQSIYTVLLFGLGVREFSLTPGYIPRARRLLRSLTLKRARSIATECLRQETAEGVEALLHARVTPVGSG